MKANKQNQAAGRCKLTVKQRKFVIALIGPAAGCQTEAARIAGYAGNRRQLAVQGAINMKNAMIQRMINESLDAMAGRSLQRLAEGLDAMKTKSFLNKGAIVRGEPQVDHANRLRAVEIWDRLRRRSTAGDADHDIEALNDAGHEGRRKEVAAVNPVDRGALREAGEIEKQLREASPPLDTYEGNDEGNGEKQ